MPRCEPDGLGTGGREVGREHEQLDGVPRTTRRHSCSKQVGFCAFCQVCKLLDSDYLCISTLTERGIRVWTTGAWVVRVARLARAAGRKSHLLQMVDARVPTWQPSG